MSLSEESIDIAFSQILGRVKSGEIDIYNYRRDESSKEFFEFLYDDMEKYNNYTYDGRFQEILFDELNHSIVNGWSYKEFFKAVKLGLDGLCVPCVITIPLNCIDDSKIESNIKLSENILLFKTEKQFAGHKKIETPLEKYFKEKVYKLLLRDHIEKAKDKNFFNFPILTILINSIDERVIIESGRIVETAYALIRMLDFENSLEEGGWGYLSHCKLQLASTYGIYYNKEGTTSLPSESEANGYGYSMRYKFVPILDVSTKGFLRSIQEFNTILSEYVSYCFMDKIKFSDTQLLKIAKWQNAIQMFNTAYEFAAQERYDAALILLLTILESLFIKNKGNKKEYLVLVLQDFFKNDNVFTADYIRNNISDAYKSRNKFVHEGLGIDNEYIYSKPLHSYQGITPGMKPFAHIGIYFYPSNIETIRNLFQITIKAIRSFRK